MKIETALFAASALVCAISVTASSGTWDGDAGDNRFSTPANWDDNQPPTDGKGVYEITNGDTVERSGQTTIGVMVIHGGSTLNITGGKHFSSLTGNRTRDFYFNGSGGTVNQQRGSYDIGHMLKIGSGNAKQGGTYNLTGGRLIVSRGAATMLNNNAAALPTVSLEIGDNTSNNTALLSVIGRSSLTTRAGVALGPTGVFSVTGSNATVGIGSNRNLDGAWSQLPGSTLKFALDQRGPSRVLIDDTDDIPGVVIDFQNGAFLELGFAEGTEPYPGSWVVFEAENTPFDANTLSGLSLSLNTNTSDDGWSFTYDNRNGHGVIVATYALVLEPE